jgi:hypothetical protein
MGSRGFSSIEAPPGYAYEFQPVISRPEDEILSQLADLLVYLIAIKCASPPIETVLSLAYLSAI